MTRKPSRHRHKPTKQTPAQAALQAWLELQMGHDQVAARLAYTVIGLHAGLIHEMHEAEASAVQLAVPQRRHLGDDRDLNRSAHVTETRDPDTAMVALIDRRLFGEGHDPEHLEPLRQRMAHSLGELAGWYVKATGEVDEAEWEPLAVRLGDLIGDQVAANAVATSLACHHRLTTDERLRKNAREQWRRRAVSFVRWLDQQPDDDQWDHGSGEGERRIG